MYDSFARVCSRRCSVQKAEVFRAEPPVLPEEGHAFRWATSVEHCLSRRWASHAGSLEPKRGSKDTLIFFYGSQMVNQSDSSEGVLQDFPAIHFWTCSMKHCTEQTQLQDWNGFAKLRLAISSSHCSSCLFTKLEMQQNLNGASSSKAACWETNCTQGVYVKLADPIAPNKVRAWKPESSKHRTFNGAWQTWKKDSGVPIEHDPTCSARSLQIEDNLKRTKVEITYPSIATEKSCRFLFTVRVGTLFVMFRKHLIQTRQPINQALWFLCISCDFYPFPPVDLLRVEATEERESRHGHFLHTWTHWTVSRPVISA